MLSEYVDVILSMSASYCAFSKSEVNRAKVKFEKKIFQINLSIKKLNKKYSFSKNNFRILFVGNLNYLPNFLACKDFIENIAPQLNKKIPNSFYKKFFMRFSQSKSCYWCPRKSIKLYVLWPTGHMLN